MIAPGATVCKRIVIHREMGEARGRDVRSQRRRQRALNWEGRKSRPVRGRILPGGLIPPVDVRCTSRRIPSRHSRTLKFINSPTGHPVSLRYVIVWRPRGTRRIPRPRGSRYVISEYPFRYVQAPSATPMRQCFRDSRGQHPFSLSPCEPLLPFSL